MIGIVSKGESGSKLPVFYYIIIKDIVSVRVWVLDKGVPMSLEEFNWEIMEGIVCSIVEGEVVSFVSFLGNPSDRSCNMGRWVWFSPSKDLSFLGTWRISWKDIWFSFYGVHGDYKLGLMLH